MDRANGNAQALEIAGLRKTFGGQDDEVPVRALRGLDMTVGHGEFVAVMGPSGCGKSTGTIPADDVTISVN